MQQAPWDIGPVHCEWCMALLQAETDQKMANSHNEYEMKWLPFYKQHFQTHFLTWKYLCFNQNFTDIGPDSPIFYKSALAQLMACHLSGAKPLTEAMITWFTDTYNMHRQATINLHAIKYVMLLSLYGIKMISNHHTCESTSFLCVEWFPRHMYISEEIMNKTLQPEWAIITPQFKQCLNSIFPNNRLQYEHGGRIC